MKSDSIFGGKYNEIVRLLAILVAMSHVCFPLAEWNNIEFGCYLPLLNLVFFTSIRKPTNASIFWDLRVVFVQVFALFPVCAFFVREASPFKISSFQQPFDHTSSHQYLRNVLRPDRTLKFTYSHTRLRKKHTDNLASFLLRPWLLAPDALSCRILQHGGLQRSLPPPKGGRRSPLVVNYICESEPAANGGLRMLTC